MTEAERLARRLKRRLCFSAAALLRSQAAELEALRQQIRENALQQLASEGQWMELTEALRQQVAYLERAKDASDTHALEWRDKLNALRAERNQPGDVDSKKDD